MYEELYNKTLTKVMVLGCGCSGATEATAGTSHYWNLVQVSFAAMSPRLSDRATYPKFFRVFPPFSMLNQVSVAMFKKFNWKKIAILHHSHEVFFSAKADMLEKAQSNGLEVIATESFADDSTQQIIRLKESGARIVVGLFQEAVAQSVFCSIYKARMFGAKYVWIVPGYLFRAGWLAHHGSTVACSEEELMAATESFFGIYFADFPEGTRSERISGMTSRDFRERYDKHIDYQQFAGSDEAGFGYDAIWASALALHRADQYLKTENPPRTILDFDYSDVEMGDLIFNMMNSTNFEGVTGTVQFTSTGDRLGPMQVEQIQDDLSQVVGILNPTHSSQIQWSQEYPIYWKGGKPPVDAFIEVEKYQSISKPLFAVMVALASIGINLTIFFLVFNVYYREIRIVKMSSPRLNNVILMGGALVYCSVVFLGIDAGLVNRDAYLIMDKISTWFLVIGFSLSFGAMFSKTWRVHRIFTTKSVVPKRIRDGQLFGQVAALVLLDVAVLLIWEIIDPMKIQIVKGYPVADPDDDDILIIPVHIFSQSVYQVYWMGALFVVNGLLLVFGAFLAWETRKVTLPALNDSKLIGMSVYTVVIMSFTGVPVSLVVNEPNAHYALIASFIIFSTTLTLCLVFIPKKPNIVSAMNDVRTQPTTNGNGDNTLAKPGS
ncbi:gamma-aminobutyric acid type B receptor subunit 2-like [Amphiura filiformis]|uniref:gamma-aminobutyric acid type B receptor subunit 2-like n=1 Tax=Amphiura filiformis TaxID=82378 RepID=UPI003B21A9E3